MSVIDSFRQPEHIDENHCLPYTAVNVALIAAVGLAVGVLSPVAGLVVLAGDALSVYLRSYVVLGTPSSAPQLVDIVDLADVFDHGDDAPDRRSESLDANVGPDVIFSTLLNAGVLIEGGDDLFLATDTREEWESTMAMLRKATDEELAEIIANAAPLETIVDAEFGGISLDGPSMSVWISRPQATVDMVTLYTVAGRGIDPMVALATTELVQMFIEVCPDCGSPVEETTAHNCRGGTARLHDSPEHEALDCADCGAAVYELPDE